MSVRILLFTALLFSLVTCRRETIAEMQDTRSQVTLNLPDTNTWRGWLQQFAQYPHRRVGSADWFSSMSWLENEFNTLGLQNIRRDSFQIQYWECSNWSLNIDPAGQNLSIPCYYELYTGFTPPGGITAPLYYVGEQIDANENVNGKIVLADLRFGTRSDGLPNPVFRPNHLSFEQSNLLSGGDVYWRAVNGGAVAVIWIMRDFRGDISEYYYIPHDESLRPIPALFAGNRQGINLRCYAQQNLDAKIELNGIYQPRTVWNLHGELPGTSASDWLLVSSHSDSPFEGVVEDGSGITSVLAQAFAWSQLPVAQRPKSMLFLATACHLYKNSPGGTYFANANPQKFQNTDLLMEIEHLGARSTEIVNDTFLVIPTLENVGIYHSAQTAVVNEINNMISNYPVAPSMNTIQTTLPLSEASGFLAANSSLPYVSFVTNPTYLLTRGDTQDKLDMQALVNANISIGNMLDVYMNSLP